MYTQEITVNNEVGLHARPATFFIQKANEFKSGIWVEKEDRRVNAKSLLGVLSLGIVKGTTITLIADGADEKEAVSALVDLVNDNFGDPVTDGAIVVATNQTNMAQFTAEVEDGKAVITVVSGQYNLSMGQGYVSMYSNNVNASSGNRTATITAYAAQSVTVSGVSAGTVSAAGA